MYKSTWMKLAGVAVAAGLVVLTQWTGDAADVFLFSLASFVAGVIGVQLPVKK